ncbi:MAG: hypothetical protein ACLPV8_22130 [Steroidobacteraceae bacterium]
MTDQHQQGGDSPVLQSILQLTEIKIVALVQLLPPEQVGNDHYIDWTPVRHSRARCDQRAR